MFQIEYKKLSWWYWLATAMSLTAGIGGVAYGFELAIVLTGIQLVHFAIRENSWIAFSVQVRFWYLILLVIALPGPMQIIFWFPLIGTWIQLFFGYCSMARFVSLHPWNRKEKFSVALVRKVILSSPITGSIKDKINSGTKIN